MAIALILVSIASGLLCSIVAGIATGAGLLTLVLAYWLGGMAGAAALLVPMMLREALDPGPAGGEDLGPEPLPLRH